MYRIRTAVAFLCLLVNCHVSIGPCVLIFALTTYFCKKKDKNLPNSWNYDSVSSNNTRAALKRRAAAAAAAAGGSPRDALRSTGGDSSGKNKKRRVGAWKDLSRWKPTDDLALITAVKQVGGQTQTGSGMCGLTLILIFISDL